MIPSRDSAEIKTVTFLHWMFASLQSCLFTVAYGLASIYGAVRIASYKWFGFTDITCLVILICIIIIGNWLLWRNKYQRWKLEQTTSK